MMAGRTGAGVGRCARTRGLRPTKQATYPAQHWQGGRILLMCCAGGADGLSPDITTVPPLSREYTARRALSKVTQLGDQWQGVPTSRALDRIPLRLSLWCRVRLVWVPHSHHCGAHERHPKGHGVEPASQLRPGQRQGHRDIRGLPLSPAHSRICAALECAPHCNGVPHGPTSNH